MMGGRGVLGGDVGTTEQDSHTQLPTETGDRNSREEWLVSACFPSCTFFPDLVMCQSLLIPWEPAPAPKHIYRTLALAIFCTPSSSKDMQMTF